jgi:hypothetical protein
MILALDTVGEYDPDHAVKTPGAADNFRSLVLKGACVREAD